MSNKYQIIVLVCSLIASVTCNAAIHAEIREKCQEKTKVSSELLDGLAAGAFPENKELKCYMACGMEHMKSMKDGKLDKEATLQMIESMPENVREPAKNAFHACDGKFDALTDPCEFAWELIKCWKSENPDCELLG